MNKFLYKLLFLTFILLIVPNIVHAGVWYDGELECERSFKLIETYTSENSELEAYMPICGKRVFDHWKKIDGNDKYMGMYGDGHEDFWKDYGKVIGVGNIWQIVYAYRDDNKGFVPVEAPLCLEDSSMVWATTVCDWDEWAGASKRCASWGTRKRADGTYVDYCRRYEYYCTSPWKGPVKHNGSYYCYHTLVKDYKYETDPPDFLTLKEEKPEETVITRGEKKCNAEPEHQTVEGLSPNCKCYKEEIEYAFECPMYQCVQEDHIVGICTPSFSTLGHDPLYCINPSLPFDAKFQLKSDFRRDGDINPKDCISSYATLDCGIANILIEAEYIKKKGGTVSNKTIEFALRLWSEHNGQSGFARMSISNKQINPSNGKCDKNVYYMKSNGEYVNIYKQSQWYVIEKFFNKITDKISNKDKQFIKYIYDEKSEINLLKKEDIDYFKVGCDEEYKNKYHGVEKRLGFACEEPGSVLKDSKGVSYKMAYALFANTLLGNDYMQTHLNELFDYEISSEIQTARLIKDIDEKLTSGKEDNNYQYIELIFEDLERVLDEVNLKDQIIDCYNLDGYSEEVKAKILPYCQVKVELVDENGNSLMDDGKPKAGDKKLYKYCTKNYCRFKTKKFAICDLASKTVGPIQVHVKRFRPKSTDSIAKFINCGSNDSQILYGFDDGEKEDFPGRRVPGGTTRETIDDVFTLSDFKCKGTCDKYFPRENMNQECKNEFGEYDKIYTTSIKDPSLRCILHMDDSSSKNAYNYSEEFGLYGTNLKEEGGVLSKNSINNKMCKIYCSDEVEYHLADKVREKAGTYFRFDIEDQVRNERNVKYLFSNIITLKRTCVSEIYYKNVLFSDTYDWKSIYDLKNISINKELVLTEAEREKLEKEIEDIKKDVDAGIYNWTKLFDIISRKAKFEGVRDDNVNKLLYDLMNCNLYTDEEIKAQGVTRPQDDKVGNIRDLIMKHFTIENNYGIGTNNYGVKIRNGKYPDTEYCNIEYEKDGETGKVKAITNNNCIQMEDIVYKYGKNNHTNTVVDMNSITTNRNTFSNISYCIGTECFEWEDDMYDEKGGYDADGKIKENSEYNYPTFSKNKTEEITYLAPKSNKRVLKDLIKKKVEIPTNDYAMFQIQTDVAFYNDSRFTVDPRGESYKQTEEELKKTDNLILEKYRFPLSKNAYNFSECVDENFLNPDHSEGKAAKDAGYPIARRCGINQNYSTINTYFRKNLGDIFTVDVTKTKKFKCYVDVEKPSPTPPGPDTRDSVLYRNIDPENVFPSSKDGYSDIFKSNWNSVLGRKTTDEIKKSANELKTTENYLEYRITLTPDDILNIRNYDKTAGKYVDEKQEACIKLPYNKEQEGAYEGAYDDIEKEEDPDNTQQYDVFYKCKSPFMDILRNSTEYGTIDPEFNGLQEKRKD